MLVFILLKYSAPMIFSKNYLCGFTSLTKRNDNKSYTIHGSCEDVILRNS